MGILERFSTIVRSNINAMLDMCEDPAKVIDQYLRDLREDLAEVKKETAGIMAEETRTKNMLDAHLKDVEKYTELAKRALSAGNEGDARVFLEKKITLEGKTPDLQNTYNVAKSNADKMRQMHNKLVSDIQDLESRRNAAKAKIAVARAQSKMNDIYDTTGKANSKVNAFSRMEEKADAMLNQAEAMAQLNTPVQDAAEELESKYSGAAPSAVDDELAKLKEQMGL